jgi:predicted ABC-type ATPase
VPILSVIAGPNGAGKSTLSSSFVSEYGITSFDFDHVFYSAWEQFDFDPILENNIREKTGQIFLDRVSFCIEHNQHFSFETNYHTSEVTRTVERFRIADFKTRLIFIALDSVKTAIERVKRRVLLNGHNVSERTINDRFRDGLALLDQTFQEFDEVYIYQSKNRNLKPLLFIQPKDKVVSIGKRMPKAIASSLPTMVNYIRLNKKIKSRL